MNSDLQENIQNREVLIDTLCQELIGPIKVDQDNMKGLVVEYDHTNVIRYSSSKDSKRHFYYNEETKQEIIQNGNTPLMQYSTGMLFPYENNKFTELAEQDLEEFSVDSPLANTVEEIMLTENADKDIQKIANRSDSNESIESSSHVMSDQTPSSLAFTFFVSNELRLKDLEFKITGGVYRAFPVELIDTHIEKKPFKKNWWNRESIAFEIKDLELGKDNLIASKELIYKSLKLKLRVHLRRVLEIDREGYFITASLTNISTSKAAFFKNVLFQTKLRVSYKSNLKFEAYPSSVNAIESYTEDLSNELLYHDTNNYAIGHGCSVDWNKDIEYIETTFLPQHEITNITPDIKDAHGQELKISMLDIAEGDSSNVKELLSKITTSYEQWINHRKSEIAGLPEYLHKIANLHLEDCGISLQRMRDGIDLLEDDSIFEAFKHANLAMFIQQITGGEIQPFEEDNGKISYDLDKQTIMQFQTVDEFRARFGDGRKGYWRAFQIAFLLMSLPSLKTDSEESIPEREIADLIWFPTGGGKTEAYLGVAATTILYRRLINANDCGTEVLMRYTLRLLTADQFQRSARLICALDLIRKNKPSLFGYNEISIGLWVGQSNTPNKNENAVLQFNNWKSSGDKKEEFLIDHCPLCRSKMGRYQNKTKIKGKNTGEIVGYKILSGRKTKELIIHCPNTACSFHERLPIYIVDEQLYKHRPTFIIGTVDKFAMLAWQPKARSLFGIGENGNRELSPPSLIIQDELHLISGPLGSTVGIYESLIEELCTDYRNKWIIKPKIICATATVKGYKEQIKSLFARETSNIKIFPSPGLSQNDSFFAQTHFDEDSVIGEKTPSRGRMYVGVASNFIGIQQLQVKTNTTVLQTVMNFKKPDPYWTLLSFYNSIRELGGSLTLFQTDIPNYNLQFVNKHHWNAPRRYINSIKELTSRLENKEVTNSLNELKVPYSEKTKAIDVCLASNIIEVGVDVERLSLMSIVGQPKNTAQYIQVSGRIGRAWYERPGLVLTLYKVSMSRDKSHFEHFKEYHQSLYKQVEATSVTPFSEPSIDRSLAGVIIAWIRQKGPQELGESPENIEYYAEIFDEIYSKLRARLEFIDTSEQSLDYFEEEFNKTKRLLLGKSCIQWQQNSKSNNYFYMYSFGSYIPENYKKSALPVLTSMRNVDASCLGTISNKFNLYEHEGVE